ncbi:MAG: hypothetical protein AAFN30_06455 [Actinomycetota bacterium]
MTAAAEEPRFAGFRELAGVALRWSWLIVIGTLLGGVLGLVLVPGDTEHSAIARVGLTTEVRWPFFDAARQRLQGIADDTDLDAIAQGLPAGGELLRVDVTAPGDETYLNVEVWAADPESARQGADLYARHLADEDTLQYRQVLDDDLAAIDRRIAELTEAADIAQEEVDRRQTLELSARRRVDDVRTAGGDDAAALAALRTAEDDLDVAQQARDQELRRRAELVEDRDVVVTAVEQDRRRAEVIRDAVAASAPVDRRTEALLAGWFTGALLALAAAWLLERQFGRVNSEAALTEILGAPAIDSRSAKGWTLAALRTANLREGPGAVIGVAGPAAVTRILVNKLAAEAASSRLTLILDPPSEAAGLTEVHTRVVHVPSSVPTKTGVIELRREISATRERLAESTQLLVVELGEPDDDGWFELALGICNAVVVTTNGRVRPRLLRRIRATIEAAGRDIDLGILTQGGQPPPGPDPDWTIDP